MWNVWIEIHDDFSVSVKLTSMKPVMLVFVVLWHLIELVSLLSNNNVYFRSDSVEMYVAIRLVSCPSCLPLKPGSLMIH